MIELDSTLMTFFNKTSTVFLITAILSMQWSVTHIHLAEDHQHDGASHQHALEAHSHDLTGHNIDAIDIGASDIDIAHADNNIIELDQELAFSHSPSRDQTTAILTTKFLFPAGILKNTSISKPLIVSSHSGFLDLTPLHSRAPPRFT